MQVGWLLDAQALESYHDEFVEAINRCGQTAVSVQRPPAPYQWDDVDCSYRNSFPEGACVVAHGDVDLVQRVARDQLWNPGVFATVRKFYCSHYYAHLGEFLLNRKYMILPFSDLPRMADFVFETLGFDGQIFLRPDSPLKIFTGQTISKKDFDKAYEYVGFNDFPRESLAIASVPRAIATEWRFVVAESKVVAGTEYHNGSEFTAGPVRDSKAQEFAAMVASQDFQPDPVWILDACRTHDGDYAVVEVGGFSFADLYGCNKLEVVKAVSVVAKKMHALAHR